MPLRTKLHAHIFADNELKLAEICCETRQKCAVYEEEEKREKEKNEVRQPPGLGAFVSGHCLFNDPSCTECRQ